MKTIDRYIFKELTKFFLISLFILTAVLFLDKVLFLTELIINKNVSLIKTFKLLVYITPAFLVITTPMAVLVGTLITFSHFSADSEIVAMKATGISFLKMLRPVLFLSLIAYLASNLIMVYALPWGNQSFRDMIFKILRSHAGYEIHEGVFNTQNKDMVLYVLKKDTQDQIMKGIFISDNTKEDGQRIITAREGVLHPDKKTHSLILRMKDGTIHQANKNDAGYRLLSFDNYNLVIEIPDPSQSGGKIMKGNREMSINELLIKIQNLKDQGKEFFAELVEFHKKFSIPFTCLILGFIGAPLGIKTARAGRSGGFATSLIVILFYYICLITGESLGGSGKLPPVVAMWVPNLLILSLAIYLVNKTAKEAPFVWIEIITDWISQGYGKIKGLFLRDVEIRV